jgi:hypothetical protein
MSLGRTLRGAHAAWPLSSRREPRRRAGRAGKVLDGGLPAPRLRIELQQSTLLGTDSDLDGKPERFEVSRQQRMVVPLRSQQLALNHQLQRGEDEEDPEEA